MKTLNLNEKLSRNCYRQSTQPAAIVLVNHPQRAQLEQLLFACPAGLYRQNAAGEITFDANGCLECGTCRLLCGEEVIALWRYPDAGFGITFRFG